MMPPAPSAHRQKVILAPAQLMLIGFGVLILLGTLTLWLPISAAPHRHTSLLTALFTATSAVCVTGLTVVQTNAHWSLFGQVVLLVLIQAGGLGVMTVSAAVFVLLGLRIRLGQRLALQEGLNVNGLSGIVRLALQILLLNALFEVAGAALLAVGFSPTYHAHAPFVAIFQAISAFNNAGFDVTGQSLIPFATDPLILLVHSLLIIIGGLGYSVLIDLGHHLRHRRATWSLHTRWVLTVTGGLLLVGTLLILVVDWHNPNTLGPFGWGVKILNAFFQSVSARTAGFASVNTGMLHPVVLFVLVILMFIGASPGGTGGGIKTTTFAVVTAGVMAVVRQQHVIEVHGRSIAWSFFGRAVTIALLSVGLIVVMTLGLLLVDHTDFLSALFQVTSAFGTVGLDTGLTTHLSSAGRVLIILTMYLGRVGPLTAAVALASRSKVPTSIHFPEVKLPIG